MTAECGTCTLCCKLLRVTPPAEGIAQGLEKPAGKWCTFCKPGKGCTIYPTRPTKCIDFECGWLANDGDPEFRPDKIHLIIADESEKIDAYIVHVDPNYPDAYQRPKGAE